MLYDGNGKRISKTSMRKVGGGSWNTTLVTHYTGIGTEIREYKPRNFVRFTDSEGVEHCISANPDYAGTASTVCPLPDTVRVVVPLPNGLGRYALQNAAYEELPLQGTKEFYLKDHLGSTRVVYGIGYPDPLGISLNGVFRAAYDYRSFGEQLDLFVFTRKVTENFTGKERDDETELGYWGARYLDLMLGVWGSVDPKRQFVSPYLYAGNGYNPMDGVDKNGNEFRLDNVGNTLLVRAMQDQNPVVQERLVILASSPQVFKSAPLAEGMKTPQFDDKGLTFYYDQNSGMSLIEQFYHEMLGHGYQTEIGLPKVDANLSKNISIEVDAYKMQFEAPGGKNGWMYKTYQKSKTDEEFGVELMTNENTRDTYEFPSYTDDYAE